MADLGGSRRISADLGGSRRSSANLAQAWDDAELDEFKAMIEEGNSGSNGLEDTERATAKAAARLAALVGSLLEAKERQLCPLIAPLGKTFAADLQGKVEEWAAGNTRAAQMEEMAACVPMAGAGGPAGPAKRAKLVAGARSSRDRAEIQPRFSRDRAEIEPRDRAARAVVSCEG